MRPKPRRRNVLRPLAALFAAAVLGSCERPAARPSDPVAEELAQLSSHQRAALTVAAALDLADDTLPARLRAELATGAAAAVVAPASALPRVQPALDSVNAGLARPLMVVVEVNPGSPLADAVPGPVQLLTALAPAEELSDAGEDAGRQLFAAGADLALIELPRINGREAMAAVMVMARRDPSRLGNFLAGMRRAEVAVGVRAFGSPDTTAAPLRWDRARLGAIELRELQAALEGEVEGVVLAASRLPALTGDSLPLPLSAAATRGLLRRDLGFEGVVMAEVTRLSERTGGSQAQIAVAALAAGVDLLLGVQEPAAVADAVAAAVESGELRRERLAQAAGRVLRLRRQLGVGDSVRATRRGEPGRMSTVEVSPASASARMQEPQAQLAASLLTAPSARAADSALATYLSRRGREEDGQAVSPPGVAGPRGGGDGDREAATGLQAGVVWPPAPQLRAVAPDSVEMESRLGGRIDALMGAALNDSVFSGAAVAIGRRGGLVVLRGYGRTGLGGGGASVDPAETIFDLASLTKVVGTTTAVALLVDDGRMHLDAPLRRYLPDFAGDGKEEVRIRHLLDHTSGLPSGLWVFGSAGSADEALRQIMRQPLLRKPGERVEYSDLGMILLGAAAERAAGMPLDRLLATRVFAPLGMESTMYLPPLWLHGATVPTAGITERDFPLKGVVHDANSFRLGGIAGHAGLFSTARDLAVFAQTMLNGGSYGTLRILSSATVEAFTRRQPGAEQRALGWDTPSRVSSAGAYFSARSFGHTGYTGTSLWIDPESGVFVVLLTNRTYPEASAREILGLRADVHDAAARAVTDRRVRRR